MDLDIKNAGSTFALPYHGIKAQKMYLRIFTIFILILACFVITSIGLQTPFGMMIKAFVGRIPYGDKSLHFFIMTGLSFLLNASMNKRRTTIAGTNFLLGSILIGAFITVEEFSQIFIPSRKFELLDLVCNYAGIFTGSFLSIINPSLTTSNDHVRQRNTISI